MEEALTRFIGQIHPRINHDPDVTLHFFQYVEAHPAALQQYRSLCEQFSQRRVNRQIGRLIRVMYRLPNTGRVTATNTSLIRAYTRH